MEKPKMRPVNAFPVKMSGQDMICIQDPFKYSKNAIFVAEPAFFIISLMDGSHSLLDIQEQFMKRYGELLYREHLEKIIRDLDSGFFLENKRFVDCKKNLEEEFHQQKIRQSMNDGISYSKNPEKLKEEIKSYLNSSSPTPSSPKKPEKIKGIISPHIDFKRGGRCYGAVYNKIKENPAELFLIFGTAHLPSTNLFTLTKKDFETPLGIAETDREFIALLEKNYRGNLYEDELLHKNEHSLEFQVVFLQYLFHKKIKIVPILCGSFYEFCFNKQSPSLSGEFSDFIKALRKILSQYDKKEVMMVAGADLAHIGPQFGDPNPVSPPVLKELEKEDRKTLGFLEKMRIEDFSGNIQKDNDKRHICGYSCIYTMLSTLNTKRGRLVKYEQATDPHTHSTVSFAGMIFH
jgi:AmmeMemoRadiSam system protein B